MFVRRRAPRVILCDFISTARPPLFFLDEKKPAPTGAGFSFGSVDQFSAGVFSLKYSCESALLIALAGSLMARLAAPACP